MRRVKFIKEHPAGIEKGKEADMSPMHAKRMVDAGYAEYINMSAPDGLKKQKTKTKQ